MVSLLSHGKVSLSPDSVRYKGGAWPNLASEWYEGTEPLYDGGSGEMSSTSVRELIDSSSDFSIDVKISSGSTSPDSSGTTLSLLLILSGLFIGSVKLISGSIIFRPSRSESGESGIAS